MNTFKMSPNTLFNLACNVIDSLEQILSTSLLLTKAEIYAQLENNLGYSLTHIRDIFKLSTNITLAKYITRRIYTNILSQILYEHFEKLTLNEKVFGIQKFKKKCLHEFPLLADTYSSEHMQLPMDKSLLRDLLNEQVAQRGEACLMKSLYKDIVNNRNPFEIKSNSEKIIIQTFQNILINLENTYFIFKDKFFKITASLSINQREIEEPFLSMLLGYPVYPCYALPADANTVIHTLHHFLTGNANVNYGFSIILEWGDGCGWGATNLVSSVSFKDTYLKEVKFVDNPFLLFDGQNVILDLSFFDKNNTNNIQHT